MEQIVARLAASGLNQDVEPIPRTGFGAKGQKIPVIVNAFAIRQPPKFTAYQYDVKITPNDADLPLKIRRQIFKHLQEGMKGFGGTSVVFDGRAIAFSQVKLPKDTNSYTLDLPEEDGSVSKGGRPFTIEFKIARTIDLGQLAAFVNKTGRQVPDASDILTATQALNVLIQHGPLLVNPSKRASFFLPPQNPAQGLELWSGFFSSLRAGPGRLFLNVDLTSAPMYSSGDLPGLFSKFLTVSFRGRPGPPPDLGRLNPRMQIKLARFIRNLKISTSMKTPDGKSRVYKIKAFEKTSAANFKFDVEGKKVSVAQYFNTQYGIKLKHPEWPLVRTTKTAHIPIEVCSVLPGQKYNYTLDPDQVAESLKHTTISPRDGRVARVQAGVVHMIDKGRFPMLADWGLNVDTTPMEVQGRILPPPVISYNVGTVTPSSGTWDLRGKKFKVAKAVKKFVVFVFAEERAFPLNSAQTAIMGLVTACKASGLRFDNEQPPIYYVNPQANFAQIKEVFMAKSRETSPPGPPHLIVAFLNTKPCDQYRSIKILGDIEAGIATQCLAINKAIKGNLQYFGNVSLKVNVKLSGTCSVLGGPGLGAIAKKPTIIFGADVIHPPPESLQPSVVGVVASMDKDFSLYTSAVRVQQSKVEVIADMDDIVLELLLQFEKTNRVRPVNILFYRDGVSEGQFAKVLQVEVNAIRLACQRISPDYKPKLTFIVAGKRHHISMFPKNAGDADPKNGNVKAGTTIDTDIVSPFQFDWYTQSHASLLGTGRSAHYTVLVDDSRMSADELQTITYHLCYTYARCTRAVSYVTPAYYADLVCTRAALHLRDSFDDSSTIVSDRSGASAEQEADRKLQAWRQKLRSVHANHKLALYFM